ncbi:MAG: CDP-diacylglycerol--glycerol-3-phosphate 3-phosphatidyltransferase [Candidatus Dadabacteria bacterium]|nr:MAG: CDP-diacylglycerol--glycerol-3-phosphate 3-phosphatidyltransferase [Candidatus Dadabacteria bacterium]
MAKELLKALPNWLTLLRIALVPVLVALLHNPSRISLMAATAVFLFASLTDYLDGWLARKYRLVSDMGKLLDPLADKILIMSALIMLVAQRSDLTGEPWVPGWVVVLILGREIWVTGLRSIASSKGVVMGAETTGKYKTATQIAAISCLILHYPIKISGFTINFHYIGINLLIVSVIFSLWSAVDYTTEVFHTMPSAAKSK